MGLTVNNKGVVKPYTHVNINETHTGLDMIGGDPHSQSNMKYRHLKNGTVDFDNFSDTNLVDKESMNNDYPSPNENEQEYVSYGKFKDEMSQNLDQYEYDIDELEDFSTDGLYSDDDETEDDETEDDETEDGEDYNFSDDLDISSVDEENQYDVLSNINESLNMFKKFKNYN
jgi:DNA repair ATPase RecN